MYQEKQRQYEDVMREGRRLTILAVIMMIVLAGLVIWMGMKQVYGADLRIPRERHIVSKPHLTAAPAYEPYFKGLPNKLNPKEPPVERPAGLP